VFSFIVILLSILFPSIDIDKEPFYNLKKDKIFSINHIKNAPIIDGVLSESCWSDLQVIEQSSDMLSNSENYIDDFLQDYPNNLSTPSFKTIVSIGSDSENIYVAARLFDSSPDSIMQRLSRKDNINPWLSDWFSIEFDSNHDHESAYRFVVNASGVQLDGMIYGDSEFDLEYNAVWDSEVQIDEYGWKVEMKIPFNMLSITQLENPWGLNINRFIFRYNEVNRWVVFKDGTPGKVSQFGHIVDFKEVDIKRSIEFRPYILSGHDRYDNLFLLDFDRIPDVHYSENYDSLSTNIGLDIKYRLSSSSSIDLTLNPDFGQVEMDPEYINLSYYEIELPEKRTFFNQTESIFDMPISIFYSRRIGESSIIDYSNFTLSEYRINAALKFMGNTKSGWGYTSVLAETAARDRNSSLAGRKFYSINRLTKNFFDGKNKIGLSNTYFSFDLNNDDTIYQQSYSFDHIVYLLSNQIFIDYQLAQSINQSNIIGNGYSLSMGYNSSHPLSLTIDMENYNKDFDINQVGYLIRNNLNKYQISVGYKIIDPIPQIREVKFNLVKSNSKNYDGYKIGDRTGIESIIESRNYNYIRFSYFIDEEHYNDYLTYDREVDKVGLPFLLPKSSQYAIKYYSDRRKDLSFNIGFEYKQSKIHQNNIFDSDDNYIGFIFELNGRVDFLSLRNISLLYENKSINQTYGFVELIQEEIDNYGTLDEYNIFSNQEGWLNRYSITLEEYFSNTISLGIYCEYLQRFNQFSNFTELTSDGRWPIVTDLITGYTYQNAYLENVDVPPVYTNNITDIPEQEDGFLVQDLNPNYYVGFYPKYTNFNLNFSFKWEYNQSSDIYVIYRLTKSVNGKIFNTINDFFMYTSDDIWTERYFDASFYVKFNYWFDI
tara:strand:- start:2685 stop:5333 length:2649 start_codon:yes stop_codon:yes gene_type:complete